MISLKMSKATSWHQETDRLEDLVEGTVKTADLVEAPGAMPQVGSFWLGG